MNKNQNHISHSRRDFLKTTGAIGVATATGGMSQIICAQDKTILKVRAYFRHEKSGSSALRRSCG